MGNLVSKRTFFSWENAPEITGRFSMEKVIMDVTWMLMMSFDIWF